MTFKLLPLKKTRDENQEFIDHPDCQDTIFQNIDYYEKIGYNPPWTGYYASLDNVLVGSAGFKGAPKNGKVEIAYVTFPDHRQKGIGSMMCKALVDISLKYDPSVKITATTLAGENYSTRILRKNSFEYVREFRDEEDGNIWEWEYRSQ